MVYGSSYIPQKNNDLTKVDSCMQVFFLWPNEEKMRLFLSKVSMVYQNRYKIAHNSFLGIAQNHLPWKV